MMLSKWVTASIMDHLLKSNINVYLYGDISRSTNEDSLEVRIYGPNIKRVQKYQEIGEITLNLILNASIDNKDLLRNQKLQDIVQNLMTTTICIYKYGDTKEFYEILVLSSDIEIINFGQVGRTLQTAFLADYTFQIP